MDQKKQEELTKFFKAIFGDTTGCIDIRTFVHTREEDKIKTIQKDHFFRKVKDIKDLVRALSNENFTKDRNVHFGVAPRVIARGEIKQTGSENDVKFLNCIFSDVDCMRESDLSLPTKKVTLKRIENFELPPSIIVDSGLGYQCYWLLKVPIPIKNRKILLEVKGILKGLALVLGGDVAGQDVSHLLRVPYTRNRKPECPKEGLEVKIIKFEPNLKYGEEFKKFMVKIEDLPEMDIELKDVKIPQRFEKLLKKNKKLQNTYLVKNRPDLDDRTGSGYDMALVNILIKNGFSDSEVGAIVRSSKTGKGIKANKQYLIKTIGKGRAFVKKKKRKKPILKTFLPGLINLVDDSGTKKYLLKNEDDKLVVMETWTNEAGIVYEPRQDLPIGYASMAVLNMNKGIKWDNLLKDVERYIKGHLELIDKIYYLIFGLWIMHTYLIEKTDITPYLYYTGFKGTGKSRAGLIAQKIAYKCLLETYPTPPVLFRTSDFFENALVIDEAKFWGSDMDKDLARIIMSRYKRGVTVPRINMDKKGERQVELHNVFGPLVICTESNIPGPLEDRCIKFQMKRNNSPAVEDDWDLIEEQRLIDLLTLFRAKFYNEELPKHDKIARRRVGEILSPLYKILLLADESRIEEFKGFVEMVKTSQMTEEATSDDATIVRIIIEFYNEGRDLVSTQDIRRRYNQDIENPNYQISDRKMGWRMRPFNFEKKLIHNRSGWGIDRKILEELAERFRIDTKIVPAEEHIKKIQEQVQLNIPD
ncbi:hypothetical protein ES707_13684 [subsurface metagenome]